MDIKCLKINELFELYKSDCSISICELNNYFHHRTTTFRFFSKDELESLEEFIKYFKSLGRKAGKVKSVKKILSLINNLVDVSLEYFNKIEIPEIDELRNELSNFKDEKEFYITFEKILDELERGSVSFGYLKDYLNSLSEQIGNNIEKYQDILLKLYDYVNNSSDLAARMIDSQMYEKIKKYIISISSHSNKCKDNVMREKFRNGKIVLKKGYPAAILSSIKVPQDVIKFENERILTIDDSLSPDLDGAFSIRREDDCYNFKVYVTNVPCFLRDNRMLAEEAYRRGVSFYIRNAEGVRATHIDMLPQSLSWDYLSLKEGNFKDVIVFDYLINDDGVMVDTSVDRRMIKVNKNLTPKKAKKLLNSARNFGKNQSDLRLYREMVKKVISNCDDLYLKELRVDMIDSLIAFPSILTNYYVGREADFTFYRVKGGYTIKAINDFYTHSVTPLRRFVSDINLAFFLNQKGVAVFDERDLNYVERNAEEIAAYFNEKEELSGFVSSKPYFVKKHVK